MPFVLQRVSDYGTSNPIVARCLFQWLNIIQWSRPHNKDGVLECLKSCQDALLSCYNTYNELKDEVDKAEHDWIIKNPQPVNNVVSIPSIISLESKTTHFLADTKKVIRCMGFLLFPFFGDEPKVNKRTGEKALIYHEDTLNWAKQKFGGDSFMYNCIKDMRQNEHPLTFIRNLRDANEHPGGKAGTLKIYNFRFNENVLLAPLWQLNDDKASSIAKDMEQIIDVLLSAVEYITLACLDHTWSHTGIVVMCEIPMEDRDIKAPIRYRVALHPKVKLPA